MTAAVPAASPARVAELRHRARALYRLLTDPALAAVWNWEMGRADTQLFTGGHLVGQLGVHVAEGDDRDGAVLAWLSAVADTYGGTVEAEEPDDLIRRARCRFEFDGLVVVLWDAIQPDTVVEDHRVVCAQCGVIGARVYAYVSDGTRACPDCADEIVREVEDDHDDDQEHGEPVAAKVTPGADGGATGGAITPQETTAARCDLPEDGFDAAARIGLGISPPCCEPRACGHCTYCDTCHDCEQCAGRGCRCSCPPAGSAE